MNNLKFAFRQLLKNRGFTVVSGLTKGVCYGTGQLRGDWLDIVDAFLNLLGWFIIFIMDRQVLNQHRGYRKSKPRANSGFKVIRFHNSIARVTLSMKQWPLVPVFSNERA